MTLRQPPQGMVPTPSDYIRQMNHRISKAVICMTAFLMIRTYFYLNTQERGTKHEIIY